MDGRHVADARMHSDATNATRLACSASYSPPSLGSTRASILPSSSSGRAWIHERFQRACGRQRDARALEMLLGTAVVKGGKGLLVCVNYPAEEAPVAAVHRLPAGDELEEEDAEREHVGLLVDDAVRVVLRSQAAEGAFDGRDRPVRPLRRQPLGEPEIRNLPRRGTNKNGMSPPLSVVCPWMPTCLQRAHTRTCGCKSSVSRTLEELMSRWMILRWHPLCRYSSPLAVPTAMPWRAAHAIAGDASSTS
jgi:hypothetical protein